MSRHTQSRLYGLIVAPVARPATSAPARQPDRSSLASSGTAYSESERDSVCQLPDVRFTVSPGPMRPRDLD